MAHIPNYCVLHWGTRTVTTGRAGEREPLQLAGPDPDSARKSGRSGGVLVEATGPFPISDWTPERCVDSERR